MRGNLLSKTVVDATGLGEAGLEYEFTRLLTEANLDTDSLTLDQLREVLAEYLQTVFMELTE